MVGVAGEEIEEHSINYIRCTFNQMARVPAPHVFFIPRMPTVVIRKEFFFHLEY